jgi:hypothetical protein
MLYRLSPVVALLLALLLPAAVARAAFEIVAHDAVADHVNRQTTFAFTFTHPPDFWTTSEDGRPLHAFQVFHDADPSDDEIGFIGADVVIIRGPEIRFANDIPIRESLNESGEEFPNAEGWGATRGSVDYELDGATISFTAGWDLLGETDGEFGYRLFALEQAELTHEVTFFSRIMVPLPAPVLLGGVGLVLLLRKKNLATDGAPMPTDEKKKSATDEHRCTQMREAQ